MKTYALDLLYIEIISKPFTENSYLFNVVLLHTINGVIPIEMAQARIGFVAIETLSEVCILYL